MGTRGNIVIKDNGKELVRIYKQYDSYPNGLGIEIQNILKGIEIVDGFGGNPINQANGMRCLSATLIKNLKEGIGNVYIDFTDNLKIYGDSIDYTYILSDKKGRVYCEIYNFDVLLIEDFLDNINMNGVE
jgi:hypothetical protein